jgi:tyrosinase
MRFSAVASASATALLASTTYGSPYQSANNKLLLARQGPGSFYPITGPTGGVHPRLEIRDLEQTGDMWNLFVLALVEFQNTDQNDISSYYQIAGKHAVREILSVC